MEKVNQTVKKLLASLDEKKREVLIGRFGLFGKEEETLNSIGQRYGITRERVRQIETLALSEVKAVLKANKDAKEILNKVDSFIKKSGGVVKEEILAMEMEKVLGKEADLPSLSFLREASENFGYQGESGDFYAFWFNDKKAVESAKNLVEKFVKVLRGKREEIVSRKKFDEFFRQAVKEHGVREDAGLSYLSISNKFKANPYGDFGLAEWSEINPTTVRDWSYLVLKKKGAPLHFGDIAKEISGVRNGKKVFVPTVHNELIKDSRFVLVGRGVYGLTEFGYEQGSVKDLIKSALKKNGPMKAPAIIKLVSGQRLFKKNTIMLHLQDKKNFKKDEGGSYFVTEV